MPLPLTPSYTLNYKPLLVADFPEHAAGIALVASEWGALEVHMIQAFTFCVFSFERHGLHASRVASRAWRSIDSLKARLDLLENVATDIVPSGLLSEFRTSIIPHIRSRARERNRIVHGHWASSPQYPEDLILDAQKSAEVMRYRPSDFLDIATRIIGTSNEIATYWHRVADELFPERRAPRPQLPPD